MGCNCSNFKQWTFTKFISCDIYSQRNRYQSYLPRDISGASKKALFYTVLYCFILHCIKHIHSFLDLFIGSLVFIVLKAIGKYSAVSLYLTLVSRWHWFLLPPRLEMQRTKCWMCKKKSDQPILNCQIYIFFVMTHSTYFYRVQKWA